MKEIEVVITTRSKNFVEKLPDNVPIYSLIPVLVSKMELPSTQKGKTVIYRLACEATGKLLADNATLANAGIQNNDVLKVMQKVIEEAENVSQAQPSESKVVYCEQCKHPNATTNKFCKNCGSVITQSAKTDKSIDNLSIRKEETIMRWEYLRVNIIVTGNNQSHLHPKLVFVVGDDDQGIEWKKQPGDSTHKSVVTRLLRKLGDDGWELVGIYPGDDSVLYFKRPKT